MPHLDCHLLSLVNSLVDLAYGSRGNGHRVELIKYVADLLPKLSFEAVASHFVAVLGRILPEFDEFLGHVLAYHVASVTEILEGLDPYDPGSSDTLHKQVYPPVLRGVKHPQGQSDYHWREDQQEVEEAHHCHEYLCDPSHEAYGFGLFLHQEFCVLFADLLCSERAPVQHLQVAASRHKKGFYYVRSANQNRPDC